MQFIFAPTYHADRPTVLCLLSDQFVRDVHMLQKLSTRYNWVGISDKKLSEDQLAWMPEKLATQAHYVNFDGPDVDAAWARSRAYGLEILAEAKAKMPTLVAVMAGNWDYWNEECMRMACREENLPFLVLLREHFLTPNTSIHQELYRKARSIPQVDGIAVAGPATVDFILQLKLQRREILRLTGFPRFDVWSAPYPPAYDRPVVLFSYLKGYGATDHFVEMLDRFDEVARRHPSIPFLIKAKHRYEIETISQLMPAQGRNVRIVDDAVLPRLIKGARAVIGFRSLSLYECLLEGAPILIPYWGQTAMPPEMLAPGPADERLKGYMSFYSDPKDLEEALEDAIANDRRARDMAGHHQVFGKYVTHSPAELATVRVERFVDEFTAAT